MLHGIGILLAIYTTPGHSIVITDRAAVEVRQEINTAYQGGVSLGDGKLCFTVKYPPECYPAGMVRK